MSCKICGGTHTVPCSAECFYKDFWDEKVLFKDDPGSVRICGTHYFIGDEYETSVFRGFGSRLFAVKFFDGRIVKTTNLWYQGDIPDEYRSALHDNAEFISPFGDCDERVLYRTQTEKEVPRQDVFIPDGPQERQSLGY